jgi:hypothetical protein
MRAARDAVDEFVAELQAGIDSRDAGAPRGARFGRRPIPIDDVAVFSEMALYVLVRREGHWWLAAGQNTPFQLKP